ncbi:hypothetical protein [Dokdonella soli]
MPQRQSLPSMPHPQGFVDSPPLHEPGSLHFDTDRQPWQRSLRWSEPPRDRRLLAFGILFAVLVTVLQLVGFALGMRSYHIHPPSSPVIHVTLIEPITEVPPPPPEPEPPIVVRASRIAIAPPQVRAPPPPPHPAEASSEMQGRLGEAGAAAPQLFNPDGSIRLGGGAPTLPQAPKNPQEAGKARWAEIQKAGQNPLNCRKTRFARNFAPDESVGSGIARKYLAWAGLYDPHDTERRAQRADEGCDPAK